MTIKQIPTEERNSLCFDCEYCRQTIKGKECCIESEHDAFPFKDEVGYENRFFYYVRR